MNVESTRLVDHRSLPNTRPARWNQTTSNMRAAAPDEKKITPIENSTGMRSVTWFRCLIVQRGDPVATCRPFSDQKSRDDNGRSPATIFVFTLGRDPSPQSSPTVVDATCVTASSMALLNG